MKKYKEEIIERSMIRSWFPAVNVVTYVLTLIIIISGGMSCSKNDNGSSNVQQRMDQNKIVEIIRVANYKEALDQLEWSQKMTEDLYILKAGCLLAIDKKEEAWNVYKQAYVDRGVLAKIVYWIEGIFRFGGSGRVRSSEEFLQFRRVTQICNAVLRIVPDLEKFHELRTEADRDYNQLGKERISK